MPAPWGEYLVTSYRLCHSILRNKSWRVPDRQWRASQTGSNRWNSAESFQMAATLPMLNPPLHTQTREILGSVFNKGSLPQLSSSIEKTVDRLLDQFFEELSQGPADFVKSAGEELPVIAIGEWLGLPSSDYGSLHREAPRTGGVAFPTGETTLSAEVPGTTGGFTFAGSIASGLRYACERCRRHVNADRRADLAPECGCPAGSDRADTWQALPRRTTSAAHAFPGRATPGRW